MMKTLVRLARLRWNLSLFVFFLSQHRSVNAYSVPALIDRRDWLQQSASTAAAAWGVQGPPPAAVSASFTMVASHTDLPLPNTASASSISPLMSLTLPSGRALAVPRVGYSLYKTTVEEAGPGVQMALQAGVRNFDVATQYGSNQAVGQALRDYVRNGLPADEEPPRTPETTVPTTRAGRQAELFVTHKVSNAEQSTDRQAVQRAVAQQKKLLGVDRLDLVMIHSPLTDASRRLSTYEALLELQTKGLIRAVGVCNYGVGPLQELVDRAFPSPTVIQLVLSPFNQHEDVATWARAHGSVLSCSAWSKLSSVQGPVQGWTVLANLAKARGLTKAQVLVRWAVQRGYLCVPRSSSKYKIDRLAIAENSWRGTCDAVLTAEEMALLNGLEERLPAGQLGILDGWEASQIVNAQWDPTLVQI